jgi:hypothetical protein
MGEIELELESMSDVTLNGGNPQVANHRLKVTKFLGSMQGKHVGAPKLNNSLETYSATLEDLSAESLANLVRAIEGGESEIGMGTRFLTWIKSMFSGEDYDTAIAKQAFSEIGDDTQRTLLRLAFRDATTPENADDVQTDVQTLLEFCQAAEVATNKIMEAIEAIPNLENKTGIVQGLANGGPKGAECLLLLFQAGKLKELDSNGARQVVLGLSNGGEIEARCFRLLLEKEKLADLQKFGATETKKVVLGLSNGGEAGVECFQWLKGQDKLTKPSDFGDPTVKQLFVDLSTSGKDGATFLRWFIGEPQQNVKPENDHRLDNLPNFRTPVFFESPDIALEPNRVALGLGSAGWDGTYCLGWFLATGKMRHLNLNFPGSKMLVQNLIDGGPNGVFCLERLFWAGKLGYLKLNSSDATELVLKAADKWLEKAPNGESAYYGQDYLKLLIDHKKVPVFRADDAKKLVQELSQGDEKKIACLKLLFKTDRLKNLKLRNITDPAVVKVKALELLEQDPPGLTELQSLE